MFCFASETDNILGFCRSGRGNDNHPQYCRFFINNQDYDPHNGVHKALFLYISFFFSPLSFLLLSLYLLLLFIMLFFFYYCFFCCSCSCFCFFCFLLLWLLFCSLLLFFFFFTSYVALTEC